MCRCAVVSSVGLIPVPPAPEEAPSRTPLNVGSLAVSAPAGPVTEIATSGSRSAGPQLPGGRGRGGGGHAVVRPGPGAGPGERRGGGVGRAGLVRDRRVEIRHLAPFVRRSV